MSVTSSAASAGSVRGEEGRLEYLCRLEGAATEEWIGEEQVPHEHVAAFVVAHRSELPLP